MTDELLTSAEGKWCCNHDDQPMVDETECALMRRVWETLAQTGGA